MCAIVAALGLNTAKVQGGGGKLYLTEYDAAKDPYQPHCTVEAAIAAGGTTLDCFAATTTDFGSSGFIDIDIFGAAPDDNNAFSGITTNSFTVTAVGAAHAARSIVKLYDADDYALSAWKAVGYLGGTGLAKSGQDTDVFDEENALIAALTGNKVTQIDTVIQQVGKAEIDFFFTEAESKRFALKYVVPSQTLGSLVFVAKQVQILSNSNVRFEVGNPRQISATLKFIKEDGFELFQVYQG